MIRLQFSLKTMTMMVSDSQCDIMWLAMQHLIHITLKNLQLYIIKHSYTPNYVQ